MPPEVCQIIQQECSFPVYSIGAGVHADGQLMICSDLIGAFAAFTPKFVKRYGEVGKHTLEAFQAYVAEVRDEEFPAPQHTYRMVEGEWDRLQEMLED